MKLIVHPSFESLRETIVKAIKQFDATGVLLAKGSRNTIKIFATDSISLNIKSFKKPNLLNQFVYKYVRDSKAKRSYEYGLKLLGKNIGTPQPIAFLENYQGLGLGTSFYVCEHINANYTYRDLVERPDLPNHEEILRAFTRFCIQLHEEGVEFKDHSPGNTLIEINGSEYKFYLVDLNRMNFHTSMDFELRMKNLCRLTPKKEMVKVMANEYSKFYKKKSEQEIFDTLWRFTSEFQAKFWRKQRMKKKLKFWKK